MSITEEGIQAEKEARRWLNRHSDIFGIHQQIDWLVEYPKGSGKYVVIEVKSRELFTPGTNFPYYGTGLDARQVYLRDKLFQDTGIDTILLTFEKGTPNIYWQSLQKLLKTDYYITKRSKIYVFKIDAFYKEYLP